MQLGDRSGDGSDRREIIPKRGHTNIGGNTNREADTKTEKANQYNEQTDGPINGPTDCLTDGPTD